MRLLLLHARYTAHYSYFDDWREAFEAECPGATVLDLSRSGAAEAALGGRPDDHDLIVVLHSLTGDTLTYLAPLERWLAERARARLLVFVGNEYNAPRSHLGLGERAALLRRVRADFIGTQLCLDAARRLYAAVPARVLPLPHALNPRRYVARTPDAARSIDIGVRSARYTPLLGDDDRVRLIERFARGPMPRALRVDVHHGAGRLHADAWAAYLDACRGTVATEAGSAFLDPDDRVVNRVADHLARRHPTLLLFGLEKRLPPGWWRRRATTVAQFVTAQLVARGHPGVDRLLEQADVQALRERFFLRMRDPIDGKCISSRHFEAIGTRTCQLMIRGRFNDILEADRHYIGLEPDLSDLEQALDRFLDPCARREVVERAHALAMEGHTHRHRVRTVLEALG